jgi:hypothetical protein
MKTLSSLTLKQREELFRQLRTSITHHSNAIEGTTLSFGETKEFTWHMSDEIIQEYLEHHQNPSNHDTDTMILE